MRKLMWFAVGFVCACLLAVYLLPEGWLVWVALLSAISFGIWRTLCAATRRSPCCLLPKPPKGMACRSRHSRPRHTARAHRALGAIRACACCLLGVTVGLLWCWGYQRWKLAPARALEGDYDRLTAEACDYPVETWYGQRVDAYVDSGSGRVRVRFYLYGAKDELRPGDRFTGAFTLARSDRSADGETLYDLQARGILLIGFGTVEETADGGAPLRYFPVRWSRAVFDRLGALLPADAAGLPQAMLTGNRQGLSDSDRDALSGAGASHIIAVSGLHAAMLLGLVLLLLGRGPLAVGAGIGLLWLYAAMAGASPSVVRAVLMLSLLLSAPLLGEENDPPTALAFAGLALLLQNPWAIANLSFQLSFGAVAGLLLVSRPLQERLLALPRCRALLVWDGLPRLPGWLRDRLLRALRRLVRFVCSSISATLGALVFTTPIAAAAFGYVPVYGVLTNLFVLPLAALILGGTLAILALGLLGTGPGLWAGWLLAWPVRAVLALCRFAARLPGARLYTDGYGLGLLIFLYTTVGAALLLRETRLRRPVLAALAALALAVGLQRLDAASADFALAALDVGQGQCICAKTGDFTAVIDCGGSSGASAGAAAASWLRTHGAARLDVLILTHYDSDHMSGAAALLSLLPVETVYLPAVDFDPENRAAVEAAALAAGAGLCYVTEDRTLSFPGGTLRLFAPVSLRNDNAACVCVLYSAGEYDMLVTGDLDAAGELILTDSWAFGPVELYVAGHHGSNRSSSRALLDAITPDTVFVSVGRNGYGLPGAEALERLEASGAAVWRTDECGTLEIRR